MARMLIVIVSFAVSCFFVFGQQPAREAAKPGAVERELMLLERELANGFVKGDKALYERVLSDDHTSVDFMGKFYDKRAVLADLRPSTKEEYGQVEMGEMRVRVYGETAVVTGDAVVTYVSGAQRFVNPIRFTDTFVKKQGRWQQAASHTTRVMQMPEGGEGQQERTPPKQP